MDYQARIRALLRTKIGLDERSVGTPTLDRGIHRAMKAAGSASAQEFWECLNKNPVAVRELIEEVVIPETSFFRHPDTFSAFQGVVLPELLRTRQDRKVRVLSVPCSTGEEPYSIAISLLESLGHPSRFMVDAADISERSLAKAIRAEYSVRAFRGQDLAKREQYLEKSPGGYRVIGAVRDRVSFRTANLLIPDAKTTGPYDCIFCRNVLIYLDRSLKGMVTAHLSRMLAPDGVLFVAPAEAAWLADSPFEQLPHVPSAFRKRGAEQTASAQTNRRTIQPPTRAEGEAVKVLTEREGIRRDSTNTVHLLETARAEADAGRLEEAMRHCRQYLERDNTSVDGHYLLGLLHDARNQYADAVASYRRTLYLDPNHHNALEQLVLLHEKRGELQASRQLKTRLERVIRSTS